MNPATNVTDAVLPPTSTTSRRDEERVEILIHLLPGGVQATTRWLRRPSSRWVLRYFLPLVTTAMIVPSMSEIASFSLEPLADDARACPSF